MPWDDPLWTTWDCLCSVLGFLCLEALVFSHVSLHRRDQNSPT